MGLTFPTQLQDPFELAGSTIRGENQADLPGFVAPNHYPSQTGSSVRSALQHSRPAVNKRNLVSWFVPEVGVVQMYINPQTMRYQERKHLSRQRTKGGYVLQYWGEELGQLSIQGTTGSSGIEGINVLQDVYRSEQLAFDPYALAFAAEADAQSELDIFGIGSPTGRLLGLGAEAGLGMLNSAIATGSPSVQRPKPTLASLAFSVEMYWSGWVFRGFFQDFSVDERADRLGLFDYNITFIYTQRRGIRPNFLGWHRSPVHGPSNSDPQFGTPYSYQGLRAQSITPANNVNSDVNALEQILESGKGIAGSVEQLFSSPGRAASFGLLGI